MGVQAFIVQPESVWQLAALAHAQDIVLQAARQNSTVSYKIYTFKIKA